MCWFGTAVGLQAFGSHGQEGHCQFLEIWVRIHKHEQCPQLHRKEGARKDSMQEPQQRDQKETKSVTSHVGKEKNT